MFMAATLPAAAVKSSALRLAFATGRRLAYLSRSAFAAPAVTNSVGRCFVSRSGSVLAV